MQHTALTASLGSREALWVNINNIYTLLTHCSFPIALNLFHARALPINERSQNASGSQTRPTEMSLVGHSLGFFGSEASPSRGFLLKRGSQLDQRDSGLTD